MKKVILIILAAAMFLLQAPAYADTVTVVSNTSFSNPQSQIKSEGEYAFRGSVRLHLKLLETPAI
ncbi:MAG: hypothetical protein GDA56_18620 [Hormoscilla sp. GM7CHS1pb]|nr:hypothetical protein [Hormoscilla sp. GM7CHS1pb]